MGYYTRLASDRLHNQVEADSKQAHTPFEDPEEPAYTGQKDEEIAKAYRLLELPYGSDERAVRTAHRRLLGRFHPDRFANDEVGLKEATRLSQELTAARDMLLRALDSGAVR